MIPNGPILVDVAQFTRDPDLLEGERWLIVVKSLDQTARRRRMIEALGAGPVMRVSQRQPAAGLVATGVFRSGRFEIGQVREFVEPRHVCRLPDGTYLLTEFATVHFLDERLRTMRIIRHPLFAFLHTIDLSADGKRALICATGYDTIIEVDLATGLECSRWNAWDNGFNPTADGVWLTFDPAVHSRRLAEGKRSALVVPEESEFGVIAHYRAAHPNVAVYEKRADWICLSIGFSGEIHAANLLTGQTSIRARLNPMPHGLGVLEDGWQVTDTTDGSWRIFDNNWSLRSIVSFRDLPEKIVDAGRREWLQATKPFAKGWLLAIDANRGLVAVDLDGRRWLCYATDPEFCIQDAMKLEPVSAKVPVPLNLI